MKQKEHGWTCVRGAGTWENLFCLVNGGKIWNYCRERSICAAFSRICWFENLYNAGGRRIGDQISVFISVTRQMCDC